MLGGLGGPVNGLMNPIFNPTDAQKTQMLTQQRPAKMMQMRAARRIASPLGQQQGMANMAMAMGPISPTSNTQFFSANTTPTTYTSTFAPVYNTYITSGSATTTVGPINTFVRAAPPISYDGVIKITDGMAANVKLPDGTVVEVHADGSFEIVDRDAKVTYRANRMREFNRFLNASDQIEGFIKYCGELLISKDDMLNLPLNTFIAWLIVEAAKADAEPEPDVPLLADLRKVRFPRCIQCHKFIPHDYPSKRLEFCKPLCFDRYQRARRPPHAAVSLLRALRWIQTRSGRMSWLTR